MRAPALVTATVAELPSPVPTDATDHRQAAIETGVLDVVEVGGGSSASRGSTVRVVAANVERGRHLDAWAELLARAGADVVLLSEADAGMARSTNRHVARELADRLGAVYAFAVEFVELSLGGEEERARLAPGARNEIGVHGGAVLSRVGLDRPAAVRLELDGWWFDDRSPERRIGGRIAVLATVGDLVVVAPHLEMQHGPDHRARQFADLLELVEDYAEERPVVLGGDLNTHTLDLGAGQPTGPLAPERFRHPVDHEPLFAEAARRGYGWQEANARETTHRLAGGGRGDLNLDWFLTRGLTVGEPEVIPAVDGAGHPISDHDAIALTVHVA